MKSLEEIREQLRCGDFVHSIHSAQRVVERNISLIEIRQAALNAEIIEDYPNDKYSPSCLVLGFIDDEKPLHIQVMRDDSFRLKIITIYKPDENKWSNNYRVRR